MKNFTKHMLSAILSVTAALTLSTAAFAAEAPKKATISDNVAKLINTEREQAGGKALVRTAELNKAAAVRAKELAVAYSDTRPDGKKWTTVLTEQGISGGKYTEILFKGKPQAGAAVGSKDVVASWNADLKTKNKIFGTAYTGMGVGIYKAEDGTFYCAAIFGIDAKKTVGTSAPTNPAANNSNVDLEAYADETFRLVNLEREKAGLTIFPRELHRDAFARLQAEMRSALYPRVSPDGNIPHDGEYIFTDENGNIANPENTPAGTLKLWMNSKRHRDMILNEKYRYVGVGIYQEKIYGTLHWSLLFW